MNTQQPQRLGEVIEAATASFTAQSYELYEQPSLGSLVKVRDGDFELYAIVCQATTQGLEPGRRPIARGKDEAQEEAIFEANPQLSKLLKSEFSALVAGFNDGERIYQYLPPHPARIHSFVYACSKEEMLDFSQKTGFLNIILKARIEVPAEELVAAALRQMSNAHDDSRAFLVSAGKELATLLGREYSQLKAILERIRP
jgi:hypothetical protein